MQSEPPALVDPDLKEIPMDFLRRMVAGLTESSALTYMLPLETRLDARRSLRND